MSKNRIVKDVIVINNGDTAVAINGSGATLAGTETIANLDGFAIKVTHADGKIETSDFIKGKQIKSYRGKQYLASTEQVLTVATFTPVPGEYAVITLVRLDADQEQKGRVPFTTKVLAADTATTVYNRLRAQINAHPYFGSFIAASGTTSLVLTGENSEVSLFGAYPSENLESSTVTVTTPLVKGFGSGASVLDQERSAKTTSSRDIFTNRYPDGYASTAKTYDTIVIRYNDELVSGNDKAQAVQKELLIALDLAYAEGALMTALNTYIVSAGFTAFTTTP